MGVVIYIVVELLLAIISGVAYMNDYTVTAIVFLVLFILGLIPVIGGDAFDIGDLFT